MVHTSDIKYKGNGEFGFPETLNVEVEMKQLTVSCRAIVKSPNSKLENTAKKSFALIRLAHKFGAVSKSTT